MTRPRAFDVNAQLLLDATSCERLETCAKDLQRLVLAVHERHPVQVWCGYRDQKGQDLAYKTGHTKVEWPNSKHNVMPSIAVDLMPVKQPKSSQEWHFFAGLVEGIAFAMHIPLRWGGNWAADDCATPNSFNDFCHFELLHVEQDPC